MIVVVIQCSVITCKLVKLCIGYVELQRQGREEAVQATAGTKAQKCRNIFYKILQIICNINSLRRDENHRTGRENSMTSPFTTHFLSPLCSL